MMDRSKQHGLVKVFIGVLTCIAGLSLVLYIAYRYFYPHGVRTCFLPCVQGALRAYAIKHDGYFPNGTNSYDALTKLYPDYVSGDARILAGLSGDIDLVVKKITSGMPITSNECSWVYMPGFHTDDDPDITLIYERRTGVSYNGMRKDGRSVGFISGDFRQIQDDKWQDFLMDQQRLKVETEAKK